MLKKCVSGITADTLKEKPAGIFESKQKLFDDDFTGLLRAIV